MPAPHTTRRVVVAVALIVAAGAAVSAAPPSGAAPAQGQCGNTTGSPALSVSPTTLDAAATTSVTVRLKVVAIDPSKLVVASRLGRNSTPSGVVIDSGTETSTQATAPLRNSPAEEIDRSSSRMFATVVSSHSRYWWIS